MEETAQDAQKSFVLKFVFYIFMIFKIFAKDILFWNPFQIAGPCLTTKEMHPFF